MVKNAPNSLRTSTSSLSLQSSEEARLRRTVAVLEAKLRVLETAPENQQTESTESLWEASLKAISAASAAANARSAPAQIGSLLEDRERAWLAQLDATITRDLELRSDGSKPPGSPFGMAGTAGLSRKVSDYEPLSYRRAEVAGEEAAKAWTAAPAPETYTQPFLDFLTENSTVFHAVDYFAEKLKKAGFVKLSERKSWTSQLKKGGKYFVERNGSSLIAFVVGSGYESGNGVAMIAGHVDALTARLKPVSNKPTKAGYIQLGVAPYAGALNPTWWDRDLGIGGRVLVKDAETGKITSKLVKLNYPIAKIPTLAPHFGLPIMGTNNAETQAVPIIGLDNADLSAEEEGEFKNQTLGGLGTFTSTQPPKLVRAIAGELSITDYSSIINWELELFDTQPAQLVGLEKDLLSGGRIDDKVCSWSAIEGLLASASGASVSGGGEDGIVKLVGVFDDEEIGSLLRQGARGNFLPSVVERISETFTPSGGSSANILSQTYANSFLISADVTHAVNPNFLGSYLEGHSPRLNVGLVVSCDSNGHMTTDSVSTALLQRVAEKSGEKLQLFMIRNDSRSGGTVGPMLSSAMGCRAIDAGIPQLSMHSVRATTGALDPGLGARIFKGFFDHFEEIDKEFE
ncbi:hypothetical protein BP6252_02109 [Coleophoma cylindrospora]|uniref:Vacuolar aspartyl aminopeptidase Lap4 n=1 Tax=Coleophoma cylindrospora TaxID=1849047 RepID=A0A3D8SDX9_9HELO|nr:hypothetical protein BP6252_02109 [Coleophoma cylindrospora]